MASMSHEIVPGDTPGGPSTSQTIMVSSLERLLAELPAAAPPDAYRQAVREENVLGKSTASGREWAFRQLRRFYALDPHSLLFRALRDLWLSDPAGRPLIALLCALARDSVLRASAELVVSAAPGDVVGTSDFEEVIEKAFPGAYGETTVRTTAQKLSSSWTQSGHLHAEKVSRKVRVRVSPTPASVTYALLLGHLEGQKGRALFDTLWSRVLDKPEAHLVELAADASQRGMLEFRNAGGVVEVGFSHLLRPSDGKQDSLL